MKYGIELEVHETLGDYKELIKKNKTFIYMPLFLIAVIILFSNGRIFSLNNFSKKVNILIILINLVIVVGITFAVHYELFSLFKRNQKKYPELYNYTIKFYEDYLIITRGETVSLEYRQIKVKQNKKCYFLYYYSKGREKNISIINKKYCNEKATKILEKQLKY